MWSVKYLYGGQVGGGGMYSFNDAVAGAGLCFTAYGSHGVQLVPNGEAVDLTTKNLPEFAEAVHQQWVLGVDRLYHEVREGLWEGLGTLDPPPSIWLRFFSPRELRNLFCGDNEVVWTEEELKKYVTFHGWDEAIELERRASSPSGRAGGAPQMFPREVGAPQELGGGGPEQQPNKSVAGVDHHVVVEQNSALVGISAEDSATTSLTVQNLAALDAQNSDEAAQEGFGSPRRNLGVPRTGLLTNLMNNDSEYNGHSSGSEVGETERMSSCPHLSTSEPELCPLM